MSNLPEHIVLNDQRQYQLRVDKEKVGVIEAKYPVKKSKGRPYMVINDRMAADKVVQDALYNTGCNYD